MTDSFIHGFVKVRGPAGRPEADGSQLGVPGQVGCSLNLEKLHFTAFFTADNWRSLARVRCEGRPWASHGMGCLN